MSEPLPPSKETKLLFPGESLATTVASKSMVTLLPFGNLDKKNGLRQQNSVQRARDLI
jgi:hypothetical protein